MGAALPRAGRHSTRDRTSHGNKLTQPSLEVASLDLHNPLELHVAKLTSVAGDVDIRLAYVQ